MTTPTPDRDDFVSADRGPDERDRLIDRIASGDLGGPAWVDWSRRAGDETTAWRTMAESLRDQLLLIDAAVAAADVADGVELPTPEAAALAMEVAGDRSPSHPAGARSARRRPTPHDDPNGHRPLSRARAAAGWMVSAMLLLALVTLSPMFGPGGTSPVGDPSNGMPIPGDVGVAGVAPANLSASDALSLYLERGRDEGVVVEEQPELVMVRSRPAADGTGYEVLYVRQILERAVVPELYTPSGRDEAGRVVMTRLAQRNEAPF